MIIGIIGSSLAGLVAGKKLAQAGHDVTIIEKSRNLGGKLASFNHRSTFFDYGISSIISSDSSFEAFMNELKEQEIISEWSRDFAFYDGTQFHDVNPNRPQNLYHSAKNGLNSIAQYLSRWVDVMPNVKAGGLTHIGADRSKKRSWMINLTDTNVFECDAVVLAAPAPEAYGVLQISQDETPSRRIIRHIDEINYDPCFSLMTTYDDASPEWKGVECDEATLAWIGNESSKVGNEGEGTSLVIRSSALFGRQHQGANQDEVIQTLLRKAADVAGSWIAHPKWTNLHYWKYFEARNPIEDYFLEMEMNEAPLALVGDYLMGSSVQDAYLSGHNLAEYWVNKFSKVNV